MNALASACDAYLASRTGNYAWRSVRYALAHKTMQANGGLTDDDILLDLGAGGTELDFYLRTVQGWRGRYWPIDGWMGIDLADWMPSRQVDWVVLLEVIEHLSFGQASHLLDSVKRWATKGVVLSTPNADMVDVLAMDATHRWSCYAADLQRHDFTVEVTSLYGAPDDSLHAWWVR